MLAPHQPPDANTVPHLTPDEFRRLGHDMVDWVADYLATLESRPVRSPTVATGRHPLLDVLPLAAPESPGGPDLWPQITRDLSTLIAPNLTHWQHPAFFAYFPCNASGPATLAEIVTAGLDVNAMLWATSPAATELEIRVLDWMAQLLHLPRHFLSPDYHARSSAGTPHSTHATGGGCIQGTASEATLVAMLAARHRARTATRNSDADQRFVVYTSAQAHSSIIKAAMIAGLAHSPTDTRRVRLIDVDRHFALDPAHLRESIARDLAQGLTPDFVAATLGTTSSCAIDPLPAIASILRDLAPHCWLHVDAAYMGAQLILPEHRDGSPTAEGTLRLADGLEHADSFCFNPHKWLLTTFDCDLFWTRDTQSLAAALSITPEYLRTPHQDPTHPPMPDLRDWQVPLGRRFRALKLWFVLRHYGAQGLRAYLRNHLALAHHFQQLLATDPAFEIVAPRASGLVCFRARGTDAQNRAIMDRVNTRGRILISHTILPLPEPDGSRADRLVLRLAVGSPTLEQRHIDLARQELHDAARHVLGTPAHATVRP